MQSQDLINSNPNKHQIICTDFGATLDLYGAELDNISVNNHAVICFFCCVQLERSFLRMQGWKVEEDKC